MLATVDSIMVVVGWLAVGATGGFVLVRVIEALSKSTRKARSDGESLKSMVVRADSDHSTTPEIMVKLIAAANGRLLEVSTKKQNPMHHNHYDWEHEMFIVEEGQTLSQAIAMVMLMKGLEK